VLVIELLRYQREDGRIPFSERLHAVRDKDAQARIRVRLRRVHAGNFGDSEPVGEGVVELRIHGNCSIIRGNWNRFLKAALPVTAWQLLSTTGCA
jgi:hypothetical protein